MPTGTAPKRLERPDQLIDRAARILSLPGAPGLDDEMAARLASLLSSLNANRRLAGSPPPGYEQAHELAALVVNAAAEDATYGADMSLLEATA